MQRNPKNTKADHLEIIRFIASWVVRRIEPFDASDTSVYTGTNPNKVILYTQIERQLIPTGVVQCNSMAERRERAENQTSIKVIVNLGKIKIA